MAYLIVGVFRGSLSGVCVVGRGWTEGDDLHEHWFVASLCEVIPAWRFRVIASRRQRLERRLIEAVCLHSRCAIPEMVVACSSDRSVATA
jgi:hypothetical protein